MARDTFYTAVDLGNSKVASIMARVGTEGELKILGTGSVPSQGMHKGRIERIDEVQTAVRSSLEEAQRYIGRGVVAGVYAGVSGTHLTCINTKDTVDNPGDVRDINAHLLDQLIQSSFPHVDRNQEVLHIIPISYDVDGLSGMRNPVGLHADKVQVEAHVVLGDAMTLKNTVKAVESGRVTIRSLVLQSLASAEATLTGDEREMGAVFVDIGSGTTDLIIYRQGSPWYSSVIPVGGDQLTKDLSVALGHLGLSGGRSKNQVGTCYARVAPGRGRSSDSKLPRAAPADRPEKGNRRTVAGPGGGVAKASSFESTTILTAPVTGRRFGHYRRLRGVTGHPRVGPKDPGWAGANRLSQRDSRAAYAASKACFFRRCRVAALGY